VEAGVVHAGKFERYFGIFRERVLPWAHGRRAVAELLEERDRAERERFYEERWNNWRWRAMFRLFFSRAVMGRLGRDPEFFRYVEEDVASRILARTRHALVELEPWANPYLRMILEGSYGGCWPMAFREENFGVIRAALAAGRMEVVPSPIEAIEPGEEPVAGFNLSDIFEYMSGETSEAVLRRLLAVARPGARLAYWNMMVPRSRPPALADRLVPCAAEAERGFARDRAFFYRRFVVEEVAG
jgi:S-adenosylmethionine-diacylglycerol 3-amino-3-carboxypropyl transferase